MDRESSQITGPGVALAVVLPATMLAGLLGQTSLALVLALASVAVLVYGLVRGSPPTPRSDEARLELALLAELLAGRVDGRVCTGVFRGRRVRVELFEQTRTEITLDTGLGAPRTGSVSSDEEARRRATLANDPLHESVTRYEPQWTAIFRVFRASKVEFHAGSVSATCFSGSPVLSARDEAERIVRLLERLTVVSEGEASLELHARSTASERCPYCHDSLGSRSIKECSTCGTRHHEECFLELGRCATFGCGSLEPVRERST